MVNLDLQPVILGGDIGAYSLARAFHEAYRSRAIVITSVPSGPVRRSSILTDVVEPGMEDDEVAVRVLRRVAAEHTGRPLLLMASADHLVRTIVRNRERLDDLYAIPYPSLEKLNTVTDKVRFHELCAELELPHPHTVVHDVGGSTEPDTSSLTFPVIAKTADTSAYHEVNFPGKKKVFTLHSRGELLDLLERLRVAGYRDRFLIQDRIPGDDSGMRILTCYSDLTGKVRYSSFGQVLLEEHTPGALGNPVGIITACQRTVTEQARRLLEHVGWTGYANFDLKFDPRDGRLVFFELNPRLGRSNFYLAAGGLNAAVPYVREHLQGLDPMPPGAAGTATTGRLYTALPRLLLLSHIADPELRARARALFRAGRATHPLWYRAEFDPRRLAYLIAAQLNQIRKFRDHHPGSPLRSKACA